MDAMKRVELIRLMTEDLAANVERFEGIKRAYNIDANLPPDHLDPRAGYEIGASEMHTKASVTRQIRHLRQCLLTLEKEL